MTKTLAQIGNTKRARIAARIASIKDRATFATFALIAGRQPNDDEYFGSRTRLQLLRKAI